MSDLQYDYERFNLRDWQSTIHQRSVDAGWWPPCLEGYEEFMLGTKIVLIHSEVSEMMEGMRKELPDDHLPHRSMEEVEAADIFIRLLDYCGARNLDLLGAVVEKTQYNKTRADHTAEARAGEGGKKF